MGPARTASLVLATTIAAWAAWPTSAVSAATTSALSYSAASDGGYSWWSSKVFEVSAEWRVPAISPTSPPGVAATWVGAQSRSDDGPFVQVGTVERSLGPGTATYTGVWSDAALGFHAQVLGELAAGDLVRATMVRRGAVWLVTLQDLASKTTTTHSATCGKGAVFTQAEWLQESPEGATYPDVAAPRFAEVKADDKGPRLSLANAEALLASNGSNWVPTRFAHDGFSLVNPTGYAKQYLADAAPLDQGQSAFEEAVQSWGPAPPDARAPFVKAFLRLSEAFAATLDRQHWPSRTRTAVAELVRADDLVQEDLESWAKSGYSVTNPHYAQLQRDQAAVHDAAQSLRALLGLPPS
jgi:hypothetical protein